METSAHAHMSKAIAAEMKAWSEKPMGYTIDLAGSSATFARELPAYDFVRQTNVARRSSFLRGNPEAI